MNFNNKLKLIKNNNVGGFNCVKPKIPEEYTEW